MCIVLTENSEDTGNTARAASELVKNTYTSRKKYSIEARYYNREDLYIQEYLFIQFIYCAVH